LYAFVVLAVGVLVFLFKRVDDKKTDANKKRDALWLLGLGASMLLLGGVPYWVTNLPVSLGFPANRALLSFMFGACFLLLGLIDLLPMRIKYFVAILFVALSAGRQFLWSVDYLRDWQAQKNMFWQLAWRAPGIKPDTLLLMNEELLFSADNSISAPLNWIYKTEQSTDMDYFIFNLTFQSIMIILPARSTAIHRTLWHFIMTRRPACACSNPIWTQRIVSYLMQARCVKPQPYPTLTGSSWNDRM
jgi:hypothetical protein